MSWFSSLFQSSTAYYGDAFGPIIDTVYDFGWSLLPSLPLPGFELPSAGGGHAPSQPERQVVPVEPGISVGQENGWISEATHVHPVFPGPMGSGGSNVPTSTVIVGDVATEVEHHPQGDFPAGSIFAPGQTWGPEVEHGLDTEEEGVALDWGGILDWGLDTISGQQPWQTFGQPENVAYFAAPNVPATVPTPSGIPGQPTTITGYTGGSAVTGGDNCGNRRYVTLDRETGKISCKRRRRRRLLTNRDLADLASLKTITGGGAALNAAVIRAVR